MSDERIPSPSVLVIPHSWTRRPTICFSPSRYDPFVNIRVLAEYGMLKLSSMDQVGAQLDW